MEPGQFRCGFCSFICNTKEDKENHEVYCYLRDDNIPSTSGNSNTHTDRLQDSVSNIDFSSPWRHCGNCGCGFPSEEILLTHQFECESSSISHQTDNIPPQNELNNDSDEERIQCSHCNLVFENIQNLIKHVEVEVNHGKVCEKK